MTRRKTKPEEIQNPDHYFRKYIAMEIKHDQADEKEYHRMFLSTDAILENSVDGISRERLLSLALNILRRVRYAIQTYHMGKERQKADCLALREQAGLRDKILPQFPNCG